MLKLSFGSKNHSENIYMEKTYYIRKVLGGRVSGRTLKKKKWVLVSFPHSATPLLVLCIFFMLIARNSHVIAVWLKKVLIAVSLS